MSVRVLTGDCRSLLATLEAGSVQTCVTDMPETRIAYLAGLVDGEGSLESQRQVQRRGATPRYQLRLSFVFGTSEPITTVAAWFGGEPKMYPATSPNRCPRWRYSIPKNVAVPLLRRLLPHLILKRQQAEIILAIESVRAEHSVPRNVLGPRSNLRMPAAAITEMESLHIALRSLKSNKRRVACR